MLPAQFSCSKIVSFSSQCLEAYCNWWIIQSRDQAVLFLDGGKHKWNAIWHLVFKLSVETVWESLNQWVLCGNGSEFACGVIKACSMHMHMHLHGNMHAKKCKLRLGLVMTLSPLLHGTVWLHGPGERSVWISLNKCIRTSKEISMQPLCQSVYIYIYIYIYIHTHTYTHTYEPPLLNYSLLCCIRDVFWIFSYRIDVKWGGKM